MPVKSQRLPLPPSETRLSELIHLLLRLPQLQELRITPQGIEVRRSFDGDDPVVPETLCDIAKGQVPDEAEPGFLLGRIDLVELAPHPEHPLHILCALTEAIRRRGLLPSAWFVADGDTLDAALGNDKGSLPTHLLGIPVRYVPDSLVPEGKLVLVGSPTRHDIDAVYGVTADIGG